MLLRTGRLSLYYSFIALYLTLSTLVRLSLYFWSINGFDFSIMHFFKIFSLGFVFDLGAGIFFLLFYLVYVLIIPSAWIGKLFDKISTYFITGVTGFIMLFSLLAEFPFWEEFSTRFNFIAVDYLIYTYEVVENINQSLPLPLLIGGLIGILIGLFYFFSKRQILKQTFSEKFNFKSRLTVIGIQFVLLVFYIGYLTNNKAEWSNNLYENELSKNGTYSFVAAFKSNELDFKTFYVNIDINKAFQLIQEELNQPNNSFSKQSPTDINRKISSQNPESQPNIVLICVESLSAEFLETFGNTQKLTPNVDALVQQSILFTQMYATGTRTVRGMEAISLSMPPTPGNSIVRRPNNDHIFSINTVLKTRNYSSYFVYGGDGYFDNMNTFFGGQGFNIIDRDRGNPLSDNIQTERTNIPDNEVSFENAWGISDEDIYKQLLKQQDKDFSKKNKGFYFVMTTSNHKPYTFPKNTIDMDQGSRESAVKYTDYAIGQYFKSAKNKPWFKNTIFVIVADHCANSAGKWEINIAKHHIPCLIYNLPNQKAQKVNQLVSQIDLVPTLFGLLNWSYESEFYGKNIFELKPEEERALIGNYRTLGLFKNGYFTEINDRKKINHYLVNPQTREMTPAKQGTAKLDSLTIAYYQTASLRFKNGWMKENSKN